ncbi:3,4-dioxygenase subunit beta [Knoellia sinensis KCTC 19936]|uniref:3,4-dioxygenase subunit beta n=1 Tax=Knoellia sinensis KCTC 19936 TaxID=1385520 RepID=A0A0A0JA74_9MICO|nr:intradiol ring-cleavage dioxygenase [Knoellia sinensis]KGN32486.1 3,4-dioxygenase subunit beta [Knoellia sinensis KCTC 19936]
MSERDVPSQAHPSHDRGLEFDVATLLDRRRALGLLGGAGLMALAGCTSDGGDGGGATTNAPPGTPSTSASGTPTGTVTASASGATAEVPDETGGPFPGNGTNGANVLDDSGIIRSDITRSIGTSTTKAEGVALTVNLTVTDSAKGYAAMEGAAVYVWQCDREGRYSMYSDGVEDENYLRGVQPTNATGTATFRTIFPAAYPGRWPHIHFQVFRSTSEATSSGEIVKTSQLALPDAVCRAVYATPGYEQSATVHAETTLTSDNVFGDDGGIHQLATVTGDATSGYIANLTIGV